MNPRKGWAAVYCRLSKEDEDKQTGESESIRNQRELLLTWAAEHEYRVYRVYSDEDYSGADRERPGFTAMLEDAEQGKFEVILAKTQSRFTRDMEMVERYLHGLFPEWGVRFVAVLDHVDTRDTAGKKVRQINGLINEWYLEDLSDNVRAVLDHKRRSGCYIASAALYGYRKDPQNHNQLLVDEPAAQIVRRIFSEYLNGMGIGKIAQVLNDADIDPPSVYRAKRENAVPSVPRPLWTKPTVRRILATRTYAGDMVQGRVRKLSYKSKKRIYLPQEEWTVVPGTHEPIINLADFLAVQKMLAVRGNKSQNTVEHMLAGLAYCGLCGEKMEITGGAARKYYRCRTAQKCHAACSGQPYLLQRVVEQLVQEKVEAYTGRLAERQLVCRLVEKIVVYPPQQKKRKIEVYWKF